MNRDDELLAQKVKSRISVEMNIAASDINVSALNGVVTLTGFVDVLAEKQDAARNAAEVRGVIKVNDDITISTDGSIGDKEIQKYVNEVLNQTAVNDKPIGVNAKVSDGVAILEGSVDNKSEKKIAMREASKVYGVKDVVSHVNVAPKNNKVDIQNELNRAFLESHLDFQDVTTEVHNGKVVLDGYVTDRGTMESLMNIAEEVQGVHKVVNHLQERDWRTM